MILAEQENKQRQELDLFTCSGKSRLLAVDSKRVIAHVWAKLAIFGQFLLKNGPNLVFVVHK